MSIQKEIDKIRSIINDPHCSLSSDIISRLAYILEQLEVELHQMRRAG